MKRLFLIVSVFLLLNSYVLPENKEKKKIFTTGKGEVWVKPDSARIFLGIEVAAKDIETAYNESKAKIEKILDSLKSLNIKDLKIKVPSYNVSLIKEPEYQATKEGRIPKIVGYRVTQQFTVLLQNKNILYLARNVSKVINTALKNGVNIINKVEYFKEDDSKEREKALKLAVKNAITNAKIIAKTAKVSIKGYSLIRTHYISYYWGVPQAFQAITPREMVESSTTFAPGKIKIACEAYLECLVE